MKTFPLAVLFITLSLSWPMQARAQAGPGCGPANIKFDVSTTKAQHPSVAPPSGKALVYFLQDDFKYDSRPRPTTRFAIDGTWVGATHSNSYFYVAVNPGEHDAYANWQSDVIPFSVGTPRRATAAAHLVTEAGKTYYFRAQDITKTDHTGGEHDTEYVSKAQIVLEPINGDEAQVLMSTFSLSSSRQKK
ncbi:MAG TPA: DUF2846 domain-containing protein [Candidatus Acidoferrales bacterium]|nr:DUF2846 domain-containing protein [Candidatus Acidoferrales bacterium]